MAVQIVTTIGEPKIQSSLKNPELRIVFNTPSIIKSIAANGKIQKPKNQPHLFLFSINK